jgi:phage tail tape measure protein, TP901 family|nr:MAG TPA: tail tape measure protein [Caudoviricetes sp.]
MADLNLQVRLRALDEMSRTFRNIGAANRRLMSAFDRNRNTLQQLNNQLRNVEGYRRQQQSLQQTGDNIDRMRNRMQRLQQQMNGLRQGSQRWRELSSQFDRASRDLARLESIQNREQQRLVELTQRLRAAGINTRELAREEDRLRNSANRTNAELERQAQRLQRIAERHQRNERRLQTAANASMAGYVGINTAQRAGHIIASPVKEYMAQEQASTELKVTMMQADGTYGAFEEINKQAIQLGNVLPGTTQDFINLARSLKEQGVKDAVMTGGGLRAAAEMAVLMNMGQEEGGTFAARMIEAHGLNPDDINKAADMTQRAYFAFGLKKDDMAEAMKYYAPTVNSLGITGEENYKKLLAIQGMAARQGLEGSMFGTNFSAMLGRLAKGPEMIRKAKSGMKAEAKHIMRGAGVDFDFYDKNGKFKGTEAMIAELEKLNTIQKKFGEQKALLVAKELFGEEAGRPAMMLAQQGLEGYRAALADMDKQADANARIAEKTSTLSAAFEQLGGVAGMLSGMIGESLRESLLWFAQTAQKFLEDTLQPLLKNHKTLVKWLMVGAAGFAVLAAISGVVLLAFAGINAAMVAASRLFFMLRGGFVWLAQLFMSNPILLAIAAIGAAIWLVYKHWDEIVGWATDRMEALANWWKNFSFTGAVKSAFAGIWQFFTDIGRIIWDSVTETAHNVREGFREMGVLGAVNAAFEGVFDFFATLGGYLASLIVEAGQAIVVAILGWDVYNSLVNAFSAGIEWVVDKFTWLTEKIKGAIQAMKEFLGFSEQKLTKIEFSPLQKSSENIKAFENMKKSGVFDAIKKNNTAPAAPTKPLAARNNVSANSNTTVNINVTGGGDNKALAAQIGKEVRGALASERRRQGGSNRSAFYDTDAALA